MERPWVGGGGARGVEGVSGSQGWQWGRAGPKDVVFAPAPYGFVLPHPHPASHDGKNLLCHPRPLGLSKPLPHPIKLYFLLISHNYYNCFFKKNLFVNKNILKITNKFIPSNKTNFQQKLNNIMKVFNKTISQQKHKSHNTKSMIQQYINLFIIKIKENVKNQYIISNLTREREKKKRKKKENAKSLVGQNKIS